MCSAGMLRPLHLNLHEQAEKDFAGARKKALLRRIGSFLRRDPDSNRLLSFEEVKSALGTTRQVYLGMRIVPVSKIVGSVGRYTDFDRAFLPSTGHLAERWKRIDWMMRRSGKLPPVSLYKIGDAYFVSDGHHRVSVACFHGVEWIDAQVTEVCGRISSQIGRPDSREHRVDLQNHKRSKACTGTAQSVRFSGRSTSALGPERG